MVKEIEVLCANPACDQYVNIEMDKIKRALARKKQTAGKALIGCPLCAHVMVLPAELPAAGSMLDELVLKNENDPNWLQCVPMLDDTLEKIPVGKKVINGSTMYRPGIGAKFIDKYTYMLKYGIDPEIAMYKSGQKPFEVK